MITDAVFIPNVQANPGAVNETTFVNQQSKFNEINVVSNVACLVLLGAIYLLWYYSLSHEQCLSDEAFSKHSRPSLKARYAKTSAPILSMCGSFVHW